MAAVAAAPLFTTIAGVAGVASAAVGVYSSIAQANAAADAAAIQAQAQRDQALYQAEVARNNALIEEQNAEQAAVRAAVIAQDQDTAARAELGALIAEQAASGLDLGSGSFLQIREGAETIAAVDRARVIQSGQIEASQHQSAAADFTTQAELFEAEAQNASVAGDINQRASLISGIGGVASSVAGGFSAIDTAASRASTANTNSSLAPRTSIRPRARAV